MMIVFYFSIPNLERVGGNIQVDLLSRRFSRATQHRIAFLYLIGTFVTISWIDYLVAQRAYSFWERGSTTTGVISYPIYIEWSIVSIGLTLLLVVITVKIAEIVHSTFAAEPSDGYVTESDTDD
jgi:TRAP-type mannitol/chloroaromatic compound transport system permease small subunit